jgi:hypothetical protein
MSYIDEDSIEPRFQFIFQSVIGRTPRVSPNYFILPDVKWTFEKQRCSTTFTILDNFAS